MVIPVDLEGEVPSSCRRSVVAASIAMEGFDSTVAWWRSKERKWSGAESGGRNAEDERERVGGFKVA